MACGELVDGDGVKLEVDDKLMMMEENDKEQEKVYHRQCLTCSRCTKAILGEFFTIGGAAVCHSCAMTKVRCVLLILSGGRLPYRLAMIHVMFVDKL
jgi:hypothetical protein